MNKINIAVFVALVLLISCNLSAFREKEIMLNQADRLTGNRQFEKANKIYKMLLVDYPDDAVIIEKLIVNLLRITKLDEAENLLEEHQIYLDGMRYVKLKISILLFRGELKQAVKIGDNYLKEHSGSINSYKIIAGIFEQHRQYEKAVLIYKRVRKISKNENLFTKEIAYDYQSLKDFPNAIAEYMKLMKKQASYSHFVLSRLKNILQEDPSAIKFISNAVKGSSDIIAMEMYALCLGEIGEYEKALNEYKNLDAEKLLDFANQLMVSGDLDTAEKAYQMYLEKVYEPDLIANARIKLAVVYIEQGKLQSGKDILLQIYNDDKIKSKKYRYKTRANRFCRELLAEVLLMQDAAPKEITKYLNEAKEFAYTYAEKKEIEFKIIHFLMMNEKYTECKDRLFEILRDEDSSSAIFKLGYYYSFLLATMESDPAADSLLGELILNLPEDDITNDALYLSVLQGKLGKQEWEQFLSAYRKKLLYKDDKAINILMGIFEDTQSEEMLILAGEWAIDSKQFEKAESIFAMEFSDDTLSEYAVLKRTEIVEDKIEKNRLSTDFLKNFPQSIFSPEFRQFLEK